MDRSCFSNFREILSKRDQILNFRQTLFDPFCVLKARPPIHRERDFQSKSIWYDVSGEKEITLPMKGRILVSRASNNSRS